MTTALHRRAQRRRPGRAGAARGGSADAGLSLVELLVSLLVAFVALTVLAGVFIGALHTLTLAKQRQSATALGTRALEQMRALPFSAITSGLSVNGLSGDTNVVVAGTPARPFLRPAAAPAVDEELQTNGGPAPAVAVPACEGLTTPLLPHRCTTTLDRVVYTVASYVSKVPSATPAQYSLTTIVSWSSKATRGVTRTVVNRSRAFSPNGTCSPANHPFNTPCQSQYHAQAGLSEGGVTLSDLTGPSLASLATEVSSAELSLPRLTSSTAVEQTVSVSGATAAHSAVITPPSGAAVTSGSQALSSASTDPSNAAGEQPTVTATAAAPLQRGLGGGLGWRVTVSPEASGTWASTSRSSAGTNSGCIDASSSTGAAVDGTLQPCGSSSGLTSGPASLTLEPALLGDRQLSTFALASFAAPSTTARAFGARFVSPHATWCPSASGFGCVAAGARRDLGTTVLGELPAAVLAGDARPGVPLAFAGAVRLTGYESRVSAASSNGPAASNGAAPPTAVRSGTLQVWNGTGYTAVDLSAGGSAALPVDAVGSYAATAGGTITVAITGQVTVTPVERTPDTCRTTLCEAKTGSVTADLTYTVTNAAGQQAAFSVTADLGSLLAKSSFVAA